MKALSKPSLYLLALLSGVLLWAAWPAQGVAYLLLVAFIPLLLVEESLYQQRDNKRPSAFFKYAYISTLSWNILSTWWIVNASMVGGIAAMILNALFMAIVLQVFHAIRLRTNTVTGYASLVILWLSFEYLHLNWECSWPWLTLGNGFANSPDAVQWYEYTGVLGGSLWIWLTNIAVFYVLKNMVLYKKTSTRTATRNSLLAAVSLVLLPLIASGIIGSYWDMNTQIEQQKNPPLVKKKVVIVQPNIDPYNEKFSGDFKHQLEKMFALADTKVDSNTGYVIFPETALTDPDIWENAWDGSMSIQAVKNYVKKYPKLSLVTGASTNRNYNPGEPLTESAREYIGGGGYYDSYNTAIQVDNNIKLQYYHKSKLVPGVETFPYHKQLGFIADWAFKLGGTSGTLGTQKEPSVFYSPGSQAKAGVAICYESIYGEYLGRYVQKGAQFIFIITNDGWWGDTPGYRQHLSYARLRAIETRRYIARSANTGISAFIDPTGSIMQHTEWWQPAVLCDYLLPHTGLTFYVLHGDYIGRAACWLALALLVYLVVAITRKRMVRTV